MLHTSFRIQLLLVANIQCHMLPIKSILFTAYFSDLSSCIYLSFLLSYIKAHPKFRPPVCCISSQLLLVWVYLLKRGRICNPWTKVLYMRRFGIWLTSVKLLSLIVILWGLWATSLQYLIKSSAMSFIHIFDLFRLVGFQTSDLSHLYTCLQRAKGVNDKLREKMSWFITFEDRWHHCLLPQFIQRTPTFVSNCRFCTWAVCNVSSMLSRSR